MTEDNDSDISILSDFLEGYGDIYTTTSSFKHSYNIERALLLAAEEKKVTKTMIILACLLGKYNLSRYINNFTDADLDWIHEKNKAANHKRNADREAKRALDEAQAKCDELSQAIASVKKTRKN